MAINSKRKGCRGESELAKFLRGYGYNTIRSQQYCGANGDADVIGIPYMHIECKRVEHLNIDDALDQAKADKRKDEIAVVMHRKNGKKWKATLDLKVFMELWNAIPETKRLEVAQLLRMKGE